MKEEKKSLLGALIIYKTFARMESARISNDELNNILKSIEPYEDYLNHDGEINDYWLKDNCTILSKAVKCAHHHLKETSPNSPDLQQLNKFMVYYRVFYNQCGGDFDKMSIFP